MASHRFCQSCLSAWSQFTDLLSLRVCWQFLKIHILITSDIKVLINNLPCFAKKIFQKDALHIAKSELLSFWHAEQNVCVCNTKTIRGVAEDCLGPSA